MGCVYIKVWHHWFFVCLCVGHCDRANSAESTIGKQLPLNLVHFSAGEVDRKWHFRVLAISVCR